MTIKAVSFNVRNANDDGGHSRDQRAPRLVSLIDAVDPDVIGLQEYTPEWERILSPIYSDRYEIFNKWRGEDQLEASPILWKKDKFECTDRGFFWYSDTPSVPSRGWDELYTDCYRICMYACLASRESGERFTFMNTHFGFGDKCQTDSAKLLAERASAISSLPTFITGDFNMTPSSLGYAEMTRHFTDANTLTGNDTRATFHGYQPEAHKDAHIDYCFVGEGVTPLSRVLISETVDGKYPSDHYGLLYTLRL